MQLRWAPLAIGGGLALAACLLVGMPASALPLQASVRTALTGSSEPDRIGTDFDEAPAGQAQASSLSLFSVFTPGTGPPSASEVDSAGATGTARYGRASADASVNLGSSLAEPTFPDGTSRATAHFEDTLVLTDGGATGSAGVQLALDFAHALDVAASDTSGSVATADLLVTIAFGDAVLTWFEAALDSPVVTSSTGGSSLLVGGSEIAGALPDALPGGVFLTPELQVELGVPFALSVTVDVLVAGNLGASGGAPTNAASALSLGWGGIEGLSPTAVLGSESGTDWSQAVPEPGTALLLAVAVLASAVRRRA